MTDPQDSLIAVILLKLVHIGLKFCSFGHFGSLTLTYYHF